jgi:hypothetical protein
VINKSPRHSKQIWQKPVKIAARQTNVDQIPWPLKYIQAHKVNGLEVIAR